VHEVAYLLRAGVYAIPLSWCEQVPEINGASGFFERLREIQFAHVELPALLISMSASAEVKVCQLFVLLMVGGSEARGYCGLKAKGSSD
jgi:hypothetical protein